MQLPPWHTSPGSQGLSHAPQCRVDPDVSVHPVEQHRSGGVHVVAPLQEQVPTMHESPTGEQSTPHPPQLCGSDRVLMQKPSQQVSGMSQVPPGHGMDGSSPSASSQSGHTTSMAASCTLPSAQPRIRTAARACKKDFPSVCTRVLVIIEVTFSPIETDIAP